MFSQSMALSSGKNLKRAVRLYGFWGLGLAALTPKRINPISYFGPVAVKTRISGEKHSRKHII